MKNIGIGTYTIAGVIVVAIVAIGSAYIAIDSGNRGGGGGQRSITVKGSTTVLPIAQSAAQKWMEDNPNDDITVSGGGSGGGIQALIDGNTNIADASREIKTSEVEAAEEAGVNPIDHVIANDVVCIVVHPSNSVSDLTLQQIRDIFAGNISNWSEVGGQDKKIAVYHRESGSGTREVFEDKVMGDEEVTLEALTKDSNGSMREAISNNTQGIGYVGMGYLNDSIKALKISGAEPSGQAASSGDYPIFRSLHMYTNGEATGLAKDFINYILSPEGQQIVEDEGFIKIS